ncbi:hypothetical protein AMTR_s00072p00131730 [Amborella trichopoda]|uniref:Uncharacterized protein n=1 Tax=Amborella trichopoda TaxID=13333 RepID=W1NTG5_AMBTC|nr:hypothetical protein AMTR_s00072p00131730 [Amborella trichopoda]
MERCEKSSDLRRNTQILSRNLKYEAESCRMEPEVVGDFLSSVVVTSVHLNSLVDSIFCLDNIILAALRWLPIAGGYPGSSEVALKQGGGGFGQQHTTGGCGLQRGLLAVALSGDGGGCERRWWRL